VTIKQPSKTFFFIDGSNFYAAQYEAFGPNQYIDFVRFIENIQKTLSIHFDKILFYASYSPKPPRVTKKIKSYLINEAKFFRSVKQFPNIHFFKGYRSKSGKEKLVDVQLAVDIVNSSHRKQYDQLFLMSGDADYAHALEIVSELSCQISLISLDTRIPQRLSFIYPTTIILTKGAKKPQTHKYQKITYLTLDWDSILKKTFNNKNPEKQAPRAS